MNHPGRPSDLGSAEQRLRLIMNSVTDHVILVLDNDGTIVDINRGAEPILGYRRDELLGRSAACIFNEDEQRAGIPLQELENTRVHGRSSDERWHVKKDRSPFWASGIVELLKNDSGEIVGFVKILRELTARRLGDDALVRSHKDLEDFAYIVAHDLQSPLQKIASFSDLLAQDPALAASESAQRYVQRIRSSASKMSALISGLLEYSRVTISDKEFQVVDLNEVVREALNELEIPIEQKRVTINVAPLPLVFARPLQIAQLFTNLMGNAINHGGQGNTISIDAVADGVFYIVSMADRGPGVAPELREKIFEVFQRGQQGRQGTGIGLTICKKIVERHGGSIWVEPNSRGGSIFRFRLPADRRAIVGPTSGR